MFISKHFSFDLDSTTISLKSQFWIYAHQPKFHFEIQLNFAFLIDRWQMKHEHKGESVKYERGRGAHVEYY